MANSDSTGESIHNLCLEIIINVPFHKLKIPIAFFFSVLDDFSPSPPHMQRRRERVKR